MKALIYAAILFAVIGLGYWLREDAVSDLKAELKAAQDAHSVETERLKRVHDDVKRKLEGETQRRLDAIAKASMDGCYYPDTPIVGAYELLSPSAGKAGQ